MIGYKLTNGFDQTHNKTQWGPNTTHRAGGLTTQFCSSDLIHFYSSPLVALLHDPIHGRFGTASHLWQVIAEEPIYDDGGLKCGSKQVTTIKRLRKPRLTNVIRVHYAILCARTVYFKPGWVKWADSWLAGNLGRGSTYAAAAYAADAHAAAHAAAYAAAYAAHATKIDFPELARVAVSMRKRNLLGLAH